MRRFAYGNVCKATLDFLDDPVRPYTLVWKLNQVGDGWVVCVAVHDIGQGGFIPHDVDGGHVYSPGDNVQIVGVDACGHCESVRH